MAANASDEQACRIPIKTDPRLDALLKADPNDPNIEISSDTGDLGRTGDAELRGNVQIRMGQRLMTADEAKVDAEKRSVTVSGRTEYLDPTVHVTGEGGSFANGNGDFSSASFELVDGSGRGAATSAQLLHESVINLQGVRYTVCCWLARLVANIAQWASPPDWITVQDPYGLSLALALAIKESWFLLWVLAALLGEQQVSRQMVAARLLGYSRAQVWRLILWPQLLPRLGWPLAAVLAYGLSVVDMAIILGPGTPPTLAVLVWRWLTDPEPALQARGSAASLVLLALLLLAAVLARGFWQWRQKHRPYPNGLRQPAPARQGLSLHAPLFLTGYAVLAVLLLWSFAEAWFFPALWPDSVSWQNWRSADWAPFLTTLWLAAAASLLCLPVALIWLEWGPQRLNAVLYLPLIVPAMPLVAAQYAALLNLRLDGTATGLVWSHLLWVLPYMVLTLVGAYRAFDGRLLVSARALGCTRLQACLRVKWPLLTRPILATLAVGFAVSVAQYLPTLFAGGGRFATVTTEAVALSAGGNRRVLAVQSLLQVALPMAAFAIAALIPYWLGRHRKGLR